VARLPAWRTDVDRNVASGKRSTSKKSGDRRWSSRSCAPELTLAMPIVTSTTLSAGRSARRTTPRTSVKRPRTFVIMKWRPMKATSAWPGSIAHSPATGTSVPSTFRVAGVLSVMDM
jgi:hypothetical protein